MSVSTYQGKENNMSKLLALMGAASLAVSPVSGGTLIADRVFSVDESSEVSATMDKPIVCILFPDIPACLNY